MKTTTGPIATCPVCEHAVFSFHSPQLDTHDDVWTEFQVCERCASVILFAERPADRRKRKDTTMRQSTLFAAALLLACAAFTAACEVQTSAGPYECILAGTWPNVSWQCAPILTARRP